jgi:hypothetical protein
MSLCTFFRREDKLMKTNSSTHYRFPDGIEADNPSLTVCSKSVL